MPSERAGVAVADHYVVGHCLEAGRDRFEHRHQRSVDQHHPVLCVIDDVGQLIGEQAQVHGVQDRAHRRRGQVRLEMLLAVPAKRRDPVPRLNA